MGNLNKNVLTNAIEQPSSIFSGADDVYLTDSTIVVRKVTDIGESTTYYLRNIQNMKELTAICGEVRYGK